MVFGALAGAVMSFATTAWQDFRDDGELFNNSITSDEYWGNIAGGAIAGLGTGACVTLGAGMGVAMTAGGAFSLGSVVLSGATAWSLGAGISFVSGGAAYAARTSIIQKETFQTGDMFVEAFANSATGTMSFLGGMMGGITGVKHPASSRGLKEFLKYHVGACWFGVYPTNALIGMIKRGVQEVY